MATAESGIDRSLLSAEEWTKAATHYRLSPRELEIVQLFFDGLSESGAAASLGSSPHTVNAHVERIFQKVGVRRRERLLLQVIAVALGRIGVE